ncbi:hypothetical protein D9615_010200 [Tricholomella constricta]|uniref:Uncharacterized protein n=1 Tax=Tricholomella constricta TaxID=117010 RepID=A0A8H5GNB3_9AGAR|nr:hypothetical protein D9615_010200 [Tricholomella constricta]
MNIQNYAIQGSQHFQRAFPSLDLTTTTPPAYRWYLAGRLRDILCELASVGDVPLASLALAQQSASPTTKRGGGGGSAPPRATPENPVLESDAMDATRSIAGQARRQSALGVGGNGMAVVAQAHGRRRPPPPPPSPILTQEHLYTLRESEFEPEPEVVYPPALFHRYQTPPIPPMHHSDYHYCHQQHQQHAQQQQDVHHDHGIQVHLNIGIPRSEQRRRGRHKLTRLCHDHDQTFAGAETPTPAPPPLFAPASAHTPNDPKSRSSSRSRSKCDYDATGGVQFQFQLQLQFRIPCLCLCLCLRLCTVGEGFWSHIAAWVRVMMKAMA